MHYGVYNNMLLGMYKLNEFHITYFKRNRSIFLTAIELFSIGKIKYTIS